MPEQLSQSRPETQSPLATPLGAGAAKGVIHSSPLHLAVKAAWKWRWLKIAAGEERGQRREVAMDRWGGGGRERS